jgi:replicative DNA helicase
MPENQLFNHDTELTILALLLKTPDRIFSIMDSIRGEMFSASIHGAIYNSMTGLVKDNVSLSPSNLKIYIEQHKLHDKTGGPDYIDMLSNMETEEKSFDLYLKALGDAYKGRTLLNLAANLPATVQNTSDIDSIIGNMKQMIDNLSGSGLQNGIHSLDEILNVTFDKIQKRTETPGISGITTGLPTLDEATGGMTPGTEWIIGSRPSMGKTTTLLSMLKSSAEADQPSLLINREMSNQDLIERLLAMDTRIPYSNIRYGRLDDTALRKLKRSYNRLKKLPFYIDSNIFGDINYVTGVIRKYKRLHDIKIVGVDYVQLLAERDGDQTAELGRISRMFKLLSVDLNLTTIVASQLNRLLESREDKHPILSDLRQSGNLEEDADIVIGLYRDEVYNKNPESDGRIEFCILKQRNGPIGIYNLMFNKEIVSIVDDRNKIFKFGDDDAKQQTEG